MTGHQATFWHAGILAKYIAADALAATSNGTTVHVTVNHDISHPFPVRFADENLRRRQVNLYPAVPHTSVPLLLPDCFVPTLNISELETAGGKLETGSSFPQSVSDGIGALTTALRMHSQAVNAPTQIAGALLTLMSPYIAASAEHYFTSQLCQLPSFITFAQRMLSDAAACFEAYNAGVEAFPMARITPLRRRGGAYELPLWHLDPTSRTRTAVFSDDKVNITMLAPRALSLSAFCRLYLCDLFIHGLGGGNYDRVTDLWIGRWCPELTIAPGMVVSASCYVEFARSKDLPDPTTLARAQWISHHSAHDPELTQQSTLSPTKHNLIQAVQRAPRGPQRLQAFKALHAWIAQSREHNKTKLDGLAARAAELSVNTSAAAIAFDRTYPFPLISHSALSKLRDEIRALTQC